MALPAEYQTLNMAGNKVLFRKSTRGIKVFILIVDSIAIVRYQKLIGKILHKTFSSMEFNKFLQGLVGFGNLRFADIKSQPSAYQTSELSEAE